MKGFSHIVNNRLVKNEWCLNVVLVWSTLSEKINYTGETAEQTPYYASIIRHKLCAETCKISTRMLSNASVQWSDEPFIPHVLCSGRIIDQTSHVNSRSNIISVCWGFMLILGNLVIFKTCFFKWIKNEVTKIWIM